MIISGLLFDIEIELLYKWRNQRKPHLCAFNLITGRRNREERLIYKPIITPSVFTESRYKESLNKVPNQTF